MSESIELEQVEESTHEIVEPLIEEPLLQPIMTDPITIEDVD